MSLSKRLVERAMTSVEGPDGTDLVTAGAVKWIAACDGFASVRLSFGAGVAASALPGIAAAAESAVRREAEREGASFEAFRLQVVDHGGSVTFDSGGGPVEPGSGTGSGQGSGSASGSGSGSGGSSASAGETPQQAASGIPGVRTVVAVGAGKGGVGKSTVSTALAVGLARRGHAVGLLDGDIYGPSLPTLLGLGSLDQAAVGGKLQPFAVHGIKAVTIGKLVDAEKPLIWRGPMAHGAFNQLTTRTNWGELDYLVIDLPPGTGDIPLTMAQSLKLTGAVVVCTPQRVAQDDATRAVRMFQQLGVEILGVVENMSYFVGDDGKSYDIFGRGGAQMMAQRMGLPFLGAVPITMSLRANSDEGEPVRSFEGLGPGGEPAAGGDDLRRALEGLVSNLENQASQASLRRGASTPTLSIS